MVSTSTCVQITGDAGLCDGVDNTGGAPAWGSITGSLASQADLDAALKTKIGTSSALAAGAALVYATGFNTVASVATSTLTPSSPLTGSMLQIGNAGSLGIQNASGSQGGAIQITDYNRLYAATTTALFPVIYSAATNSFTSAFSTTTNTGLTANAFMYTGPSGIILTVASSGLSLPNTALQNSSVTVNTSAPLGGGGAVTLGGAALTLTCATCYTGNGFDFTPTTWSGLVVNSTSTGLWLKATSPFSLMASSSFITQASSTQLTNSGSTWLGGFTYGDIGTDVNGKIIAIATSTAYGSGTNGQVLGWTNGIPGWVSTSSVAGSSASSTLLSDSNTFSGFNIFNKLLTLASASSTDLSASNSFYGPFAGGGLVAFDVNKKAYAVSTTSMNASITGNANTATTLATPRAINTVNFDGSAAITINAASSSALGDRNTWSALQTIVAASTTDLTTSNSLHLTQLSANTLLGLDLNKKVVNIASSTLYGTGTGGQVLLWDATLGRPVFGATSTCVQITGSAGLCDGTDDTGAGGGAWPFTPSFYNSIANQSTTTPLWLRDTMVIASTTYFTNASTTGLTIGGSSWFTGLTGPGPLAIDSTGKTYVAATTTAANPTGTIGALTASNGVSTSYLRADASQGCQAATASVPGCLQAADFATFASKITMTTIFNVATNFGTSTIATTTPIWAKMGVYASSTSQFVQSSTTLATFGTVWNTGIVSSVVLTDSGGKEGVATTQTCTNQVFRVLSAAYVVTCSSVADADITGTIGIAHGGTNSSSFAQPYLIAYNGTSLVSTSTPTVSSINATSTATSTFAGGINVLAINETGTATSTFANGINVSSGCFSVAGTCVGSSGAALTGGTNSMLAVWTSATTIGATSTPIAANYIATSTLGTSYFYGNLTIATTTTMAFNVNDAYGTSILRVSTASTTAGYDLLQLWSSTSTGPLFAWDQYGHMAASSTAPVLSTCGTSPSLSSDSSDFSGTITVGSVAATACTLTFGTPHAIGTHCVISNQNMSVANAGTYTESVTGFTFSETGLTSAKLDYICVGK